MTIRDTLDLPQNVGDDTPLRLDVAARIAFPDGSMKAGGLRREARRGRLAIERIAGRYYTTLQAIKDMRDLCRVMPNPPAVAPAPAALPVPPPISSSIAAARSALDALTRPARRRSRA